MRLNFVQNTFKYTMEATCFLEVIFHFSFFIFHFSIFFFWFQDELSQFSIFIQFNHLKKSHQIVHVQTSHYDLKKISRPIALALTASNHMFKVHYWLLRSYNKKSFKRFELHFKTFFFIFSFFLTFFLLTVWHFWKYRKIRRKICMNYK